MPGSNICWVALWMLIYKSLWTIGEKKKSYKTGTFANVKQNNGKI